MPPSKVFADNAFNIAEAIKVIQSGYCKRIDVTDRIKVYECKNVIRVDIKEEIENEKM